MLLELSGLATALFFTGLLLAPRPAAAQVKASDAQDFLGQWTLPLQTQNGPFTMDIDISERQDGMVAATVSSQQGESPVEKVGRSGPYLTLDYSLDYQGQAISVSISLRPTEGGLSASLDFAGGQYTMSGKATKASS